MDKAGESAEWLSEKSAEMATTVDAIKSVFDGWGDEVSAAFENSGVSADSFAAACAEAGISTETLHAVGSENFAKLMESCNGNVNQMIGVIQNWNGTPFLDKDGKVTVDDAKLVDAQGNVYTWNGTDFVDKDGNVLVDDQNLVDAQGNVYTWNGTILTDKDGKVVVDKGSLDQASSKVKSYNDQKIKDKKGSVKVDTSSIDNAQNKWAGTHFATKFATIVTRNVLSSVRGKATGGIRTHADGGMVRYHANGGSIVNVPGTGYPLDMVGEDGAEAIVPLTNKRYAMPFVKMIAGEIGRQNSGHTTINNYTLTIDGVRANGSQRAINLMEALFDEFNLTSEMGVC